MSGPRPLRDPVAKLLEGLNQQRRADRTLYPTRVASRNPDGTVNFQRLDGECVERQPQCSVYEGQLVERPCKQFTLQGAAGLPMASAAHRLSELWLENIEPYPFVRGWSGTAIAHGKGFTARFAIDFLLEDGETINPGITVSAIRYLNAQTVELDLVIAADAELTRRAVLDPVTGLPTGEIVDRPLPVAIDNVGSPL